MLAALPAEILAMVCFYLSSARDYTALALTCKTINARMFPWHNVVEQQMSLVWAIILSSRRMLSCKPPVLSAINIIVSALHRTGKGVFATLDPISSLFLRQLCAHGSNVATTTLVNPITHMIAARDHSGLASRETQLRMLLYLATAATETDNKYYYTKAKRHVRVTEDDLKLLRGNLPNRYLENKLNLGLLQNVLAYGTI